MISIIIPCRYRADLTQTCIDSIIQYTKDFELIVVQEGEDEGLTKYLDSGTKTVLTQITKEEKEKLESIEGGKVIKFVHNKTPKGYSGALNAGMKAAEGDYFCFMNNDTVATPHWMDEMLKAFKDKEDVGLVSPTFWGMGNIQSVDWNRGQQYSVVMEPLHLCGVCYLVPRKVMENLPDPKYPNQWDEDFFHGGEDFDLTIRIQNAGYQLIVARKSFIYHYGGASTRELIGNDLQAVRKHNFSKVELLIKKHNLDEKIVFEKLKI